MKYKYETGENVKRSKNFEKRKKFVSLQMEEKKLFIKWVCKFKLMIRGEKIYGKKRLVE